MWGCCRRGAHSASFLIHAYSYKEDAAEPRLKTMRWFSLSFENQGGKGMIMCICGQLIASSLSPPFSILVYGWTDSHFQLTPKGIG